MSNHLTINRTEYVLCYDLNSMILHYVEAGPGQYVSSGMPKLELFDDKEKAHKRIVELGFDLSQYLSKEELEK